MIDREGLRKLAERALLVWGEERPDGVFFGEEARFCRAANPQTVIALLDEIERLRTDKWALEGSEASWREHAHKAEVALSAMTAARDEACFLAEQWMSDDWRDSSTAHEHLAQLRTVGSKEGGGDE